MFVYDLFSNFECFLSKDVHVLFNHTHDRKSELFSVERDGH